MSTRNQINLSKLKTPQIIATPTSETIYQKMLEDLQAQLPEFSATVESDPAVKILQSAAVCAERLSQDINQAGHQVMLAFASGSNLDNLGALVGVERFLVEKGDDTAIPPTKDEFEDDETFRARIQQAPESFTTAGSHGSYIFHALDCDADVDDVAVYSESPGIVNVIVLSKSNNGAASKQLLQTVDARLSSDDIRPLSDFVKVSAAEILDYTVTVNAFVKSGPDSSVVIKEAKQQLKSYLDSHFKLGESIALSRIYGAFASDNIERVSVLSPTKDLILKPYQAARCTQVIVNTEVVQ